MPLEDADPDKWEMAEHTEVKHRILRKYLVPWTRILSSGNPRIHYFDGFAGRARYREGEPGSPLLALEVANNHSSEFEEFLCTFNDLDPENFDILEEEVNSKLESCSHKIQIDLHNEAFEDIALEILEDERHLRIPSFVFIDPFGYDSAPFEIVSEIMNLQSTGNEVFFTFMVHYIRRFINDGEKEEVISAVLGTEDWKYIRDVQEKERKEDEILRIYVAQLKNTAEVEYVFPFQMKRPERNETIYYLIHATNHFKGFKIMKDVMFGEGADDLFAYLGPEHYGFDADQQTLFESTDSEDSRIADLADFLFETFEGRRIRFWDIMKELYTKTDLIETHYRAAIYKMEEEHKTEIHNFPNRERGTSHGLGHHDEVTFEQKYGSLSDY